MNDKIFTPHFRTTPLIKESLEALDRSRWLVEGMLITPKYATWARRAAAVRRAVGTTRIEGASLGVEAVAGLAQRAQPAKLSEDETANVNALETYEWIDYLSDQRDIPIDELVVRELNRHFLRGASEILTPGAYRKGQNTVGGFTPPDQGDVPPLMRSFALWLRDESDTTHPVLRAAIAHLHLVAIHPFWDGNGRTARGLAALVLQRSGYGFNRLLSLEYHFFEQRPGYYAAIARSAGKTFTLRYDATPFLNFFASELSKHVQHVVASLTDWHRRMGEMQERVAKEHAGLNSRQIDGLIYALQSGRLKPSEYKEITGASPLTSSRDLAGLVKSGLLIAEGRTRGRSYRLAERLRGKST